MTLLVKFKLPGTEPTTIYIDVDRIFAIQDRGMIARGGGLVSGIEIVTGGGGDGTINYNVCGTPDEVVEIIRRARVEVTLGRRVDWGKLDGEVFVDPTKVKKRKQE